jgi:hypothetical protein
MSSVARTTIEKARYFLDCAEDSGGKNPKIFCTFLEAAIVFTRSVTLHLKKELAHHPKFESWYAEQQEALKQNKLGRFLLEQRNLLLKQGPLATHRVIEMTAIASAHADAFVTIKVIRGAPWYRRSLRTLWEDATYPLREWVHSYLIKRKQAKARKLLEKVTAADTARDNIYFSVDEWKSEPAILLVRRLLIDLEAIVVEAEQRFLSCGNEPWTG